MVVGRFIQRLVGGCHDLFNQAVRQRLRGLAVLDIQQIFNVALGSLDGRKIQTCRGKVVCHGVPLGHLQHLAVGGRVTDNTLFTDLFAAGLKLRLDEADADSLRRADRICDRENMLERDERNIDTEKGYRL